MIGFLCCCSRFVLLGFMLIMERVEEPLNQVAVERDIEQFLDDANPEELDTFVREGTDIGAVAVPAATGARPAARRRGDSPAHGRVARAASPECPA